MLGWVESPVHQAKPDEWGIVTRERRWICERFGSKKQTRCLWWNYLFAEATMRLIWFSGETQPNDVTSMWTLRFPETPETDEHEYYYLWQIWGPHILIISLVKYVWAAWYFASPSASQKLTTRAWCVASKVHLLSVAQLTPELKPDHLLLSTPLYNRLGSFALIHQDILRRWLTAAST